jgi:hypothetical protein
VIPIQYSSRTPFLCRIPCARPITNQAQLPL